MKYTLLFFSIVVFFSSCKKTGVNQNLDPNAQVTNDFSSTKNGSKWHYGTRAGVSYTRYATGKDSVKNGLKFSYYERKDDTAMLFKPEYFGKNGSFYVTLLNLDNTDSNYVTYVLWKDSAKQGDTWVNVGSVNYPGLGNVSLNTSSKVVEYNTTLNYASQTFDNVVHVHSTLKATAVGISIGTLDVWFTKGLGIIREEADINIASVYKIQHTDSLLSYHIEP